MLFLLLSQYLFFIFFDIGFMSLSSTRPQTVRSFQCGKKSTYGATNGQQWNRNRPDSSSLPHDEFSLPGNNRPWAHYYLTLWH